MNSDTLMKLKRKNTSCKRVLALPQDVFFVIFLYDFNISETKVKQKVNNGVLFFYHQLKQQAKKKKGAEKMAKSRLVKANEKIAENVVGVYKNVEEGVVGGYKKIEEGAVGGFQKIADKFVDSFLTKEGETVGEARKRLAEEQKERENAKRKGD